MVVFVDHCLSSSVAYDLVCGFYCGCGWHPSLICQQGLTCDFKAKKECVWMVVLGRLGMSNVLWVENEKIMRKQE